MKNRILSLAVLCTMSVVSVYHSSAEARSMRKIIQNCMTCHGDHGVSNLFRNPSIAGQNPEYFAEQIHSFLDRSRDDSGNYFYMLPAIGRLGLTDSEIQYIAEYFAKLPAGRSKIVKHSSAQLAFGSTIYNQGIPDKNVTACITCHGVDGRGSAMGPRIAAQDFFYLKKRMLNFKHNEDSKASSMPDIAKNMNSDEILAAAKYINSMAP